ncbi:phage tail assembly protein [Streptomyces sp. HU2014]|uniref:phage tail assembly protein n=1 Tax=Streptomyces sp. HU2014 TaxID=2939414 RepID=UPI00200CEE3C|nr:phage tail assembly protein [Streptomyces sp. HU2014]UQI46717.1 phage tail assembly protein [Streptomyces sp. HU2014]
MAEVESEYVSLPLEPRHGTTVHLRNLLMLPEEDLKKAQVLLRAVGDGGGDDLDTLVPVFRELLLLVADDPAALTAETADWPLGMFVRVVGAWQEVTQVPEAQDSDS